MNIFYLDECPSACAIAHCDKHVVKMILEYSQLLSTAHRVLDGHKFGTSWILDDEQDESFLYRSTHVNHPSAIWTRLSDENYRYLHELLVALCSEYTFRYGRVHKSESTGLVSRLAVAPNNILVGLFTQPTPAMPLVYQIPEDSISSYRLYYALGKSHLARWKNREKPKWLI